MMGKSWKMHKRAFLHFSGLHPPYFDFKKPIISWTDFVSKYGDVRSVTCIDVHFRPWNTCLCLSQIFIHHILISKTNYFLNFFFQSKMMGKSWKMHKRAFLHFSGLQPPYFDLKKPIISWTDFVSKNMVR